MQTGKEMSTIKDDTESSEAYPRGSADMFIAGISRMLVVVVLLAGAALVAGDLPLHHFDLPCHTCHEAPDDNGVVTADVTGGCTHVGCHDYDPVINHAVDVVPVGVVPAGMKLDDQSRITCLTCHEDSAAAEDNDAEGRFLTSPSGMGFCGSCHVGTGETPREMAHWQFSTKAHLGDINPDSEAEKEIFVGEVDGESRNCLSCHDDVTVTVPSFNESSMQRANRWNKMTDHPIGMEYSRVAMSGTYRAKSYVYPLNQDIGIRLFEGKVGCGSCHSPYSNQKSNLVMENRKSELCKQCHDK